MAFSQDPLGSPETFYYMYDAFYTGDEDLDYMGLDSYLVEISHNLDQNPIHAGAARDFELTLDNFDENSSAQEAEIVVSFVVRLWEDDDNEINLILQSVKEELESYQIMVEDIRYMGTGPPRRR